MGGSCSRVSARRISSSAPSQSPRSWSTSDRRSRHCPRKSTRSGCGAHQRLIAAVHSWARRQSKTSWHPETTLQYTPPTTSGVTSSVVTATIASSSSASALVLLGPPDQDPPQAMAGEGDQVRVAEAVADGGDPLKAPRLLESPSPTACMASGNRTNPCSAHRRACRQQPPHPPDPAAGLGALAPLLQLRASQKAARAARSGSRRATKPW